ncbi:MAG TPA: isoprenylcysteine carboxylmethyltransferase family protein [Gemmatimonadales bacterium]|nr:isoprenylcysteine carboxylmethyltransferase family protein [Gemmatimonadales bacterium]
MLWPIRHLLAIAVLPFTVTVLIPRWIARREGIVPRMGHGPAEPAIQLLGLGVLGVGLVLFGASLYRFIVDGRGTLAPWDPPRRLVVRGPYRYVRNPMISGVALVLFGEAAVLLSRSHLLWALCFLGINAVYIPLLEEPYLAIRFGESYDEYRRHVPRLLPRMRPWQPGKA